MRLSGRLKPVLVTAAAMTIAGCVASLPEPPLEINTEAVRPGLSNGPIVDSNAPAAAPTSSSSTTAPVSTTASASSTATAPELPAPAGIEIEVLHKANFNPFDLDNGKSFRVLQTLEIYRSELGRHSIETPKPIDFETQQVLVSSAGEKPTGGYNISVADLEEIDDKMVVTVIQSIPGASCINTLGKTHPFEFILIPSRKPVEIYERQKVEDC